MSMPQNVVTFEDFVSWIKMTKTESWADYMWEYDQESEKRSSEESGGWRTVQRGRGRGNTRSNGVRGRGRGRQHKRVNR